MAKELIKKNDIKSWLYRPYPSVLTHWVMELGSVLPYDPEKNKLVKDG